MFYDIGELLFVAVMYIVWTDNNNNNNNNKTAL